MKRLIYSFAICATLVSCTNWAGSDEQSVGGFDENGQALDVTQTGSLTKNQGTLNTNNNEASRQADTKLIGGASYYTNTSIDSANNKIAGGATNLDTLAKFQTKYGFGGPAETVTYYYNRGDLGIGREMHCVDTLTSTGGQAACYVKNFAAGDANSEFQFGLSSNIAFDNMNAHNEFATVAMAYRHELGTANNNVIFAVYKKDGTLLDSAALDRTGLLYATGANTTSTPGQDFNNHIPSNCASCHAGGRQYDPATHSLPHALFLPFDLDQFEYDSADPAKSRANQEAAFRKQNALVWKVAAFSGADAAGSLRAQLDGWYGNTPTVPTEAETLPGTFNSAFVPTGWSANAAFYTGVVRGSCRSCHVASSSLPFNDATSFKALASFAVDDMCAFTMPHALQTVRLFWQSSQPEQFAQFLEAAPNPNPTQAARLRACGPGNVATLDPPQIMAAIAPNLLAP